ncbi:MAG: sigma-70 family RNA polymerase sigma factor [Bacteroidetes bacterium]|nr:sigma-70 family RNA polymerase sigma factor [Bacteroidota bacterium]MBS1941986.1 sigma-70 family RNA polymerase sigma factor [Bacteroidota bacterium]
MFLRRIPTQQPSDEALAASLRAGDRSAAGLLWDRYAHLLFGVAMKYLKNPEQAKDLVMELFADLPALSGRHEVKAFRPWIHTVVRNRCLMVLRKHDPHAVLDPQRIPAELQETDALDEGSLQALEAAIGRLPEAQQQCIRLFHLERQSYRQVAARTGFTGEQVRSHLQNGRRNLRNMLDPHGRNH